MRRLNLEDLSALRRQPVSAETLRQAASIVQAVQEEGEPALRRFGEQFGDLQPGTPLVLGRSDLLDALERLPSERRNVLQRTAERIRRFAEAQRASLVDMQTDVQGGQAGLRYAAVERAGCYAPGGRFPLPSSVLMTAVTARAAGVKEVWVASPRPTDETLAAAALADADAFLVVGGAQAIGALAYGAGPIPACDAIVGPGNRWVTAAKQLVAGLVAIDMLAGPSELVVLADGEADAERVAADLLAQAEHDPDAIPMLVSISPELSAAVEAAIERQLETLPTAEIARQALENGFCVDVANRKEGVAACNRIAPEHLALHVAEPEELKSQLRHFGALFVGEHAAEVMGDYGAGPNHVLPTGGTARSVGGLSVLTFLRAQAWLRLDDAAGASALARDAADLARMEGLEAHARAAELRI